MEYQPPDPANLANVHSLNLEFLNLLRAIDSPIAGAEPFPADLAAKLSNLGPVARSRLARCPFLIFSLAEHDATRWPRLFDGGDQADLIRALDRPAAEELRLVSAALGFLWQQAIRSPYAARVVSGAPLEWCEQLAESILVGLFRRAANETGLLQLRCRENTSFWRKLIVAGTSDERAVRRAARLSALQTLLTNGHTATCRQLPAAACAMPGLPQRVSVAAGVSQPEMRGYNTPPDESADNKKSLEDLRKR